VKNISVANLAGKFIPLVNSSLKNFKDVLLYLVANFIGAVFSYLTLPFFTNHLSPEDFGIWGYVTTANAFITPFLALDLHSYYLVEFYKLPDGERKSSLFNSLISFSFLWTLCFLAMASLIGGFVFRAIGISIPFHPFMSVTLLSNLTSTFFVFLLLQYRLQRKSYHYALLTILQTLLSFSLAILAIIFYKADVSSRIFGYSAGLIILGLYSLLVLKRKHQFRFSIEKATIKKGLWFSSPLIPYSLALLLFDFLDRFFLERSLNLADIGYYSLAFQFTSLLSVFFIAVLRVFEPDIMKWIHQDQHKKFIRFFNGYLLLLAVVSVSFSLLAPYLLSLVANPKFKSAGPISVSLVTAFYFKSVLILLLTVLISFSKTRFQMLLMVGAVIVFAILGYPVTDTYKTKGLILLKAGIYILMCVLSFLYVQKYIKLKQSMVFTMVLGILIMLYCNFQN
jgi:O-antigen/teichoic acid export membrane protein